MRFIRKFFNPRSRQDGDFLWKIEQITGFKPGSAEYYRKAFRHSSAISPRNRHKIKSNERLEFLGDAILDAVISEHLFKFFPDKNEGELTQARSKLVSREHLNSLGEQLNLEPLIETRLNDLQKVKSLIGNTLEALIGAIYLDLGYESTKSFIIHRLLHDYVELHEIDDVIISYTSKIYEWVQKEKKEIRFIQEETKGPLHSPEFFVKVIIDGEELAQGRGDTKKKAKEECSRLAYEKIGLNGS
jgi:ribonuclease-3